MKLNNKKILILCAFLMALIVVIVGIIYWNSANHKKKVPHVTTPPTSQVSPSGEKPVSNSEITTKEDALVVIERLYHEKGYEFRVKDANEQEIIVEKINKNTSQVVSEFRINMQDQTIVNYQIEQIEITSEAKES